MYPVTEIYVIKDILLRHRQTLSVTESVTSGHLQAALSLAENAACFFQGGLTVYNLGQKARQLGIDSIKALVCNCVSEDISRHMALSVAAQFSSDYGISVTGYASPVPEKNITDLFAYYAFACRGVVFASGKLCAAHADALQVQLFYVDTILQKFATYLQKHR